MVHLANTHLNLNPKIKCKGPTPTLKSDRLNFNKSLSLSLPLRGRADDSIVSIKYVKVNPETSRTIAGDASQTERDIFKGVKSLFNSCRGNRKIVLSNPQIKLSRQERIALNLPQTLDKFSRQHKLRQKKQQIKYASTLKRIKKTGEKLGCEVRAKSEGIQLKMAKEKEERKKDILNYTFGKQMNRLLKKKIVKQSQKCYQQATSLNFSVQNNSQAIDNSLRKNDNIQNYRQYGYKRMQAYLKGKATNKSRYPFYVKKELESKISKIHRWHEEQLQKKDDSSLFSGELDSPRQTSSIRAFTITREISVLQSQSSPRLAHRSSRLSQYQDDIIEFLQICSFYEKIQKEILRYLPNNHLANKIDALIAQVQHGNIIDKIYAKSCEDRNYFSPSRVVAILKKYQGILGTMNYIVNVIKLNVSAERRKRFKDTEKSIQKYQSIIKTRNAEVCEKLKQTTDYELRKNIFNSIVNSKMQTRGMNPTYREFAEHTEKQDLSKLDSIKYSTIMCDILKYETIMK